MISSEVAIYCDCCSVDRRVKMAVVRDGRLIILDKRFGKQHLVSREVDKLQEARL